MARVSGLYKAILVTLNALFLLEVLPIAAGNVALLISNNGTVTGGGGATTAPVVLNLAWLSWVYVVNSFVVVLWSFLAVCAVFMANHGVGRFILWVDIAVKFLAMIAYGVLVGFRIQELVRNPNAYDVVTAMASVYASGVMGFAFCVATAVWELRFLLWRNRTSDARHLRPDDSMVNYTYI